MTSPVPIAARMRWLACLAVLLMVVAPTVSRGLAAVAPGVGPTLMAMCTSMGPRTLDVAPLFAEAAPATVPGKGAPAPLPGLMSDACDYCGLVAPLVFAFALFHGALRFALPPPVARLRPIRPSIPRNARGLGAQGPPLVA